LGHGVFTTTRSMYEACAVATSGKFDRMRTVSYSIHVYTSLSLTKHIYARICREWTETSSGTGRD